jgi:hypothetical protein
MREINHPETIEYKFHVKRPSLYFPQKLYFPFQKGLDGLEPTATHAEASAPEALSLTSLFCVIRGKWHRKEFLLS